MNDKAKMAKLPRGAQIPFGLESVVRESLCYGCGLRHSDFRKPIIGVITQQHGLHPGEIHAPELARRVMESLRKNGAVPILINIAGHCDGVIAARKEYVFAQRNLIADAIELAAEANQLDGLVLIASCDKNVPAALMAAARINLPAILVAGGVMPPGELDGKKLTVDDVNTAVGRKLRREIDEHTLRRLITHSCPGGGACPTMTTGATMQIVAEALGMCLPNNSTMLGRGQEILSIADEAAKRIISLYKEDIRARDIITPESIKNSIKVCLAVGGSIHAMYHIPAIGIEAGIELDYWELFDRFSHRIPVLVGVIPNGEHTILDLHRAGGVPAVMKALSGHINPRPMTVTGEPIRSYYESAKIRDPEVIHSVEAPWKEASGIAILKGNIAEQAVVRVSGVKEKMLKYTGVAKVFTSIEEARCFIRASPPRDRTVLVVPYQGLKGAPGLNSLLPLSSEIIGMGLEETVAIVTDGRFSGGARGLCVGLATPEGAEGGNIALIEDGDIIHIDIENRSMQVELSEEQLERRRQTKPRYTPKLPKSIFLRNFLNNVQPLSRGGVSGPWQRD